MNNDYVVHEEKVPTEFGEYTIKVSLDQDPIDPRKDWEPLGTMVCWHSRYTLGEVDGRKEYGSVREFLASIAGIDLDEEDEDSPINVMEEAMKTNIILNLYLYDHSGISMSCSSFLGRAQHADWDSGPVGFLYLPKADLEKEGYTQKWVEKYAPGKTVEQAVTELLIGEVKTYDDYLTGQVYGFEVEDEQGNFVSSCWGFFGYYRESGLLDDARATLNRVLNNRREKQRADIARHGQQIKQWIKNHVPIIYRKANPFLV